MVSLNVLTNCERDAARSSNELAAAAASLTRVAFCFVTPSICVIAVLTCLIPAVCSVLALAISDMMSVTRVIPWTISLMVAPASSTN